MVLSMSQDFLEKYGFIELSLMDTIENATDTDKEIGVVEIPSVVFRQDRQG
jgi:hypothetical protein